MRKTILMLINGFGVEQKGSAEIFSHNLMPNLDNMTKEVLFSSIATNAANYTTGYEYFSVPPFKTKDNAIDNEIYDKTFYKNEILLEAEKAVTADNKMHIFCNIDDSATLLQLKSFAYALNPDKNKKVFIHFILSSPNMKFYDGFEHMLNKVVFENSEHMKVGFVVGKNFINSDDFKRMFIKEQGEKWNQFSKKIDVLKTNLNTPENVMPFKINDGFSIAQGDSILFLNYTEVDIDKIYNELLKGQVNMFSLYKYKEEIPFMFERVKQSHYLSSIINENKINLMVFAEQDNVNTINYYMNGKERKLSGNITFAINDDTLFSNKEAVINTIESTKRDGYVLDYDIGKFNRMEDIKDTLHNIDGLIGNIYEASKEKGYTFIISSLYGIQKTVREGVVDKVINFGGKVPILFYSNEFTKADYSIGGSDTTGLMFTYLTNINDEVKRNALLHKKSKLDKMLHK